MLSLILLSNVVKAQETNEEPPIKVDTFLLTMPLVVKDKMGRNVSGLKKEDFSIVENGVKQNIEYFFNEESPMNVAILIDTSGSTREVLGKIQKAAREFVKVLRPEDKAMIVSFDYRTLFLSDLTSDKKKLTEAIDRTRIAEEAGSDMNAAVVQLVNNHFNSFKGRKAVIVLSDEWSSSATFPHSKRWKLCKKRTRCFTRLFSKPNFMHRQFSGRQQQHQTAADADAGIPRR